MRVCLLLMLAVLFNSCESKPEFRNTDHLNLTKRIITNSLDDSLFIKGASYLSIYSQIYNQTGQKIHNLTATVSIRNMNRNDTIYIDNAEYFNTEGRSIRRYLEQSIYVAPMETVEIVIDEVDQEGGTGANFIFDWKAKPDSNEPFFEAVMVSSFGQGMSFTTNGMRLNVPN